MSFTSTRASQFRRESHLPEECLVNRCVNCSQRSAILWHHDAYGAPFILSSSPQQEDKLLAVHGCGNLFLTLVAMERVYKAIKQSCKSSGSSMAEEVAQSLGSPYRI
mmetsp:Transcript_22312/g.55509  ORF Transcript_22312/g.55509 Transcript_22312/m.55509 type:complete len:107 (-) Transcript_22312:249-569(-)